jgi:hypothetical protein
VKFKSEHAHLQQRVQRGHFCTIAPTLRCFDIKSGNYTPTFDQFSSRKKIMCAEYYFAERILPSLSKKKNTNYGDYFYLHAIIFRRDCRQFFSRDM